MNSRGSGHLRQPNNVAFHFATVGSHQVCQFVYDDYYIRKSSRTFFRIVVVVVVIIFASREFRVIAFNVAIPGFLEYFVSLFHFFYGPAENIERFFIFNDYRTDKVRYSFIAGKFHAFRVKHYELER